MLWRAAEASPPPVVQTIKVGTFDERGKGSRRLAEPKRKATCANWRSKADSPVSTRIAPKAVASPYYRSGNDNRMLLKELREATRLAGWSQRTLADRVGVDVQTIKRLESLLSSRACR